MKKSFKNGYRYKVDAYKIIPRLGDYNVQYLAFNNFENKAHFTNQIHALEFTYKKGGSSQGAVYIKGRDGKNILYILRIVYV